MFELFSLLVAILALVVARKSFNQSAALRARLDAIEAAVMQARSGPPTLAPHPPFEQTPDAASPNIAAEHPTIAEAKRASAMLLA
jgi:hypothetical protein